MLLTSSAGEVSSLILEQRKKAYEWGLKSDLFPLFELEVTWGENDANAHVSNTRYFNWLETARIAFIQHLTDGKPVASGKGIGMILGSVSNKYLRPVVGPDRVLVGHKVHSINPDGKRFTLISMIYSYNQNSLVSIGDSVMVMYDYDQLKAIKLPADMLAKLESLLSTAAKL